MKLIALAIFLISLNAFARTQTKHDDVTFGPVYVAQYRMDLDLNDFKPIINSPIKATAKFQEGSLQWIRSFNDILMPRAILDINLPKSNRKLYLEYGGVTVPLTIEGKNLNSKLYISLLSTEEVKIFDGKNQIGKIKLKIKPSKKNKDRQVFDYTCSRNNITIEGLEDQYVSTGCTLTAVGGLMYRSPHFQVAFTASNIKTINGSKPPFIVQMTKSSTIELDVIDENGKQRKVKISARVPKRVPRLLTAWGTGAYGLTGYEDEYKIKTESFKQKFAWPLFLYGKFDLEGGASIKFFDAAVLNNQAFFNNFGLYFSYLLADGLDKRLEILPLLGAQTLTYRITGKKTKNKVIYPQGFEFLLKHGLGIKNNTMALGLFLFPSDEEKYSNMWFRFGVGMFWELNYIMYSDATSRVSTFGLSFGIPLASFF